MVYSGMVEKSRPHHDLRVIKASFATARDLRITGSALKDAAALGYNSDEIVAVIQSIEPGQFYKSMTAYHDHKIWHDVYHVLYEGDTLYVKFTDNAVQQMTLLSFKAK